MEDEEDISEAMGFYFADGEWVPIFELTPEMEDAIYAAGDIGPEGLTMIHSDPLHTQK